MMIQTEQIKKIVQDKYAEVADQSRDVNAGSCCGSGCGCGPLDTSIMAEDYSQLHGYVADADLGLGCGLPTEFALIKEGDTVIDLGSGAGNDAFIARSITGPTGKVIGVDFTEKMIAKARVNTEKLKFNNVEFRFGDIESLPVTDNTADVVVSNCVLNLVPDKAKAFGETFRVLKPGAHFSVSDVVLRGDLPPAIKQNAELYAGCVSGAIKKDAYIRIIEETGFINIKIQKEKKIELPDELIAPFLNEEEFIRFKSGEIGIYSITVYAEKPTA